MFPPSLHDDTWCECVFVYTQVSLLGLSSLLRLFEGDRLSSTCLPSPPPPHSIVTVGAEERRVWARLKLNLGRGKAEEDGERGCERRGEGGRFGTGLSPRGGKEEAAPC